MSKELAISTKETTMFLKAMGIGERLTENETMQFVEICKAFQLNPFKKEIHVSKFGDNLSIIVGYEVYIKRAERSGMLNGWHVKTEGSVKDNTLKAVITINRKDWSQPFIHEVYYFEYVQKTKQGDITKFWREKPYTMIKKVAISQGFRLCFSEVLGGMPYTAEEYVTEEAQYAEIVTETATVSKEIVKEVMACEDVKSLTELWNKYPQFQKNVEFMNAVKTKKESF